jgi:hypothetical protein
MADFLSDLDMRVLPPRTWNMARGRKWELLADLRFYSDRFRGVFVAPCGYRTNLASIPRGLWNLYPRDGPYIRGSVLHDAGYERQLVTEDGQHVHLVRHYCDELFDEAMEVDGVPAHRRRLFVSMVDLFGSGVPTLVD